MNGLLIAHTCRCARVASLVSWLPRHTALASPFASPRSDSIRFLILVSFQHRLSASVLVKVDSHRLKTSFVQLCFASYVLFTHFEHEQNNKPAQIRLILVHCYRSPSWSYWLYPIEPSRSSTLDFYTIILNIDSVFLVCAPRDERHVSNATCVSRQARSSSRSEGWLPRMHCLVHRLVDFTVKHSDAYFIFINEQKTTTP